MPPKKHGASSEIEFNLDDESLESSEYSPSNQDDDEPRTSKRNEATIPASLEERLNNKLTKKPQIQVTNTPSKIRSNMLRACQLKTNKGGMALKTKISARYSNVSNSSLANRLYGPSTKRLEKKNFIVNERIEEYTTKKNAFIEKQAKLKFNEGSLIGETFKTYTSSLTASEIRLDLRKIGDDKLIESLVKNMDSTFEEHDKLIEVMESMSKELADLKQQYNKSEQMLKTVTLQLDEAKMTIEELKNTYSKERNAEQNVNEFL